MYITIGDGGNREGLATKWLAQTPVSAFRMATYGHGELQVVNATAAHWTWHTNVRWGFERASARARACAAGASPVSRRPK